MTQSITDNEADLRIAEQLTETIDDWQAPEAIVDETRRLIRNVALAGQASRNGYRYSEQALRNAAALYLNRPVFLDHAANQSRPFERSARDLVGSIVEPRFDDGRIRGDIQVVDTEAGRTFLALASANAPSVGMSHVVLVRRNSQGDIVEQIQEVVSVDAVVFPATTTSLKENQHEPDASTIESPPAEPSHEVDSNWVEALEEIVRQWPAVQHLLGVSSTPSHDSQCMEGSTTTSDVEVERILTQSGLPDFAVTECFRRCLMRAGDTPSRRQLCADRLHLIEETRRLLPASRERIRSPVAQDEQVILAAFRRQPASVLAGYG
ncbi:MAG: hypothetical protein ACKVT0_06620 [Planctomycetaceae bacterium]